uniref:Sex-determining region Y protein n=1 Tax=Parastrongyloides trichosuri TaxID=131310 RepID=A0A0N4ZD32_PARTI
MQSHFEDNIYELLKYHSSCCRCEHCRTVRKENERRRVRRPMNAFMLWSKEQRSAVAAQNPGILNSELSRILGIKWKELPLERKKKYIIQAEAIREEHYRKYPDFKYTKDHNKQQRKAANKTVEFQNKNSPYKQKDVEHQPSFDIDPRIVEQYISPEDIKYLKDNAATEFDGCFPSQEIRQEFGWFNLNLRLKHVCYTYN